MCLSLISISSLFQVFEKCENALTDVANMSGIYIAFYQLQHVGVGVK